MKIFVNHKVFKKINNKWVLYDDRGTKEIFSEQYHLLLTEKWKGDRRYFNYYHEFGLRLMHKLINVETTYKEMKSVRIFTFK